MQTVTTTLSTREVKLRDEVLAKGEIKIRLPSVRALTAAFGADKARAVRRILETETAKHEDRFRYRLFDGLSESETEEILGKISEVLGGYGAEYIAPGSNLRSPSIHYVNMGDAFSTTILCTGISQYDAYRSQSFRIGNWGDIVERGNYE